MSAIVEKLKRPVIFIIAVGVIAGLVFLFESLQSQRTKEIRVGRLAPQFTLRTIDGRTLGLADYRGKVVLVNIWATWCPPCRQEIPSMVNLYKEMKGKDFEILAVSIDDRDIPNALVAFAKEYKMEFPILMDVDKKVAAAYKTTGVPESFLVDKNGIIQKIVIGADDWYSSANRTLINQLLIQR